MDKSAKQMIAWLDRKRDEINEQIIHAAPDEQGAWMPELQMINAIAERLQEMTAVEYLDCIRSIKQICADRARCNGCPFDAGCPFVSSTPPRRAVEIVKKWKEEQDEGSDRV